jgi:hypothetical protein
MDGKEEAAPFRALYNKVFETLGKHQNTLYSQLPIHCSVVKSDTKNTKAT